jgi:hypothetical protein
VVPKGGESGVIGFILLPYAALAIAMLLVLLFLALNRAFCPRGYRAFREHADKRGNAIEGSGLSARTASKARRLATTERRTSQSTDIKSPCGHRAITSRPGAGASKATIRSV